MPLDNNAGMPRGVGKKKAKANRKKAAAARKRAKPNKDRKAKSLVPRQNAVVETHVKEAGPANAGASEQTGGDEKPASGDEKPKFWKWRSKHGRYKTFNSANELWETCCEYFDKVLDTPLTNEKAFCSEGIVTIAHVNVPRVMTVSGLCLFLGITRETWNQWRKSDDFSDVVKLADEVIYTNKYEGGTAGQFNSTIIIRDLGLSDKVETNNLNESQAERLRRLEQMEEDARVGGA